MLAVAATFFLRAPDQARTIIQRYYIGKMCNYLHRLNVRELSQHTKVFGRAFMSIVHAVQLKPLALPYRRCLLAHSSLFPPRCSACHFYSIHTHSQAHFFHICIKQIIGFLFGVNFIASQFHGGRQKQLASLEH